MFLNFILDHIELLVSCLTLVLSVIIFIIRKKPVQGLSDLIYDFVIRAVRLAESTDLKGIDKLNYAVDYVKSRLANLYPDLDVSRYTSFIKSVIEDILSTPHKK